MTPATTYIAEACRLYVLLVLVAAAWGKAAAMRDFKETIADLFHVPRGAVRVAAFAIIATEFLIALLLLTGGRSAQAGLAAAAALFVIFTVAILAALIQGRAVSCNCFGGRGHVISIWDLARNATLITACGAYLGNVPVGHSLDMAAWLLLSGIAVILFLVSTSLDEIARLAGWAGPAR